MKRDRHRRAKTAAHARPHDDTPLSTGGQWAKLLNRGYQSLHARLPSSPGPVSLRQGPIFSSRRQYQSAIPHYPDQILECQGLPDANDRHGNLTVIPKRFVSALARVDDLRSTQRGGLSGDGADAAQGKTRGRAVPLSSASCGQMMCCWCGYSPFAPNSLNTRTARSCALLTASAGDLPPSTSPIMSVQKLDESND